MCRLWRGVSRAETIISLGVGGPLHGQIRLEQERTLMGDEDRTQGKEEMMGIVHITPTVYLACHSDYLLLICTTRLWARHHSPCNRQGEMTCSATHR